MTMSHIINTHRQTDRQTDSKGDATGSKVEAQDASKRTEIIL